MKRLQKCGVSPYAHLISQQTAQDGLPDQQIIEDQQNQKYLMMNQKDIYH